MAVRPSAKGASLYRLVGRLSCSPVSAVISAYGRRLEAMGRPQITHATDTAHAENTNPCCLCQPSHPPCLRGPSYLKVVNSKANGDHIGPRVCDFAPRFPRLRATAKLCRLSDLDQEWGSKSTSDATPWSLASEERVRATAPNASSKTPSYGTPVCGPSCLRAVRSNVSGRTLGPCFGNNHYGCLGI